MEFSRYTPAYVARQQSRIDRTMRILDERDDAVKHGRAIPIAGSLANGRGRHLDASVLFLDVCGFSKRRAANLVDQEAILTSFAILFPELIAIVEDYGGTVEKNTGDGLMAYFVSTEGVNHPQRAVACALTMMEAAFRFINPNLTLRGLDPFEFRVAIDSGVVTVAQVGKRDGFGSIVAIGSTANIAAKMLAYAKSSQILIGNDTANAIPPDWQQHLKAVTPDGWNWTQGRENVPYQLWFLDAHWSDPLPPLQER